MNDNEAERITEQVRRLSGEKDAISNSVRKLVAQKQNLQQEIQHLKTSCEETNALIASEEKLVKETEDQIAHTKLMLTEIRDKYENQIYDKIDVERDIQRLDTALQVVNQKLQGAQEAKVQTDSLSQKLQHANSDVERHIAQRIRAENIRRAIEEELLLLHKLLYEKSVETSHLGTKITREIELIKKKLQSRMGIENVLLHLVQEVEFLKERVDQEIKARSQLEMLMEVEFMEVDARLLSEKQKTQQLTAKFETSRSAMIEATNSLNDLISKLKSGDTENAQTKPPNEELDSLQETIKSIEQKVLLTGSLLNEDLSLGSTNSIQNQQAEIINLKEQLANILLERSKSAVDNDHWKKKIEALERQLNAERAAREALERKIAHLTP